MNKTTIEYLTHTWNPIAMRCTPVSEGCENCWHIKTANRLKNNTKLPMEVREAYAGDREPVLVESRMKDPLKRKTPSIIGVQFMGDLFHEDVKNDWIRSILFPMYGKGRHHTYLILTKRHEHMYDFFKHNIPDYWPLPNIWLGVTCENQRTADERIPVLLQIPAAVRFVSFEPLLGEIDFSHLPESGAELDWVIVGGESGPEAKPMHPDWVRSIRDQCQEDGVPFFFKQWGGWCPDDFSTVLASGATPKRGWVHSDTGELFDWANPLHCAGMMKVGKKKKAGRMFDGREWNEYPHIMQNGVLNISV